MSNDTEQGLSPEAATNAQEVQGSEELQTEVQGAESAPAGSETDRSASGGGFQKRISKLTYQLRQAERERDELRQQHSQRDTSSREEKTEGRLKSLADFEYDEQRYNDYLFGEMDKRMDKRLETALEKQFHQRETQQQQKQRFSKFSQSEREFAKKTPDYFDVTHNDPSLPFTETVKDLLASSDIGPELAYHLAKNPDQLYEIADMDERSAARAMGRMEERIQAARKAPPGRSVTRAPAPATTVDATDETLEKEDGEMSDAEWLARRRKAVHSRGL